MVDMMGWGRVTCNTHSYVYYILPIIIIITRTRHVGWSCSHPSPKPHVLSGVNVMCVPHLPVVGGGVGPIGSQDVAAGKEREIKKKPLSRRSERDCRLGAEIQRVKARGGGEKASIIFYCRRVSLWPACRVIIIIIIIRRPRRYSMACLLAAAAAAEADNQFLGSTSLSDDRRARAPRISAADALPPPVMPPPPYNRCRHCWQGTVHSGVCSCTVRCVLRLRVFFFRFYFLLLPFTPNPTRHSVETRNSCVRPFRGVRASRVYININIIYFIIIIVVPIRNSYSVGFSVFFFSYTSVIILYS